MFKGRSAGLLLLAALMAAGAAWLANDWAVQRNITVNKLTDNERSVIVAKLDIPYGQKVEPQHVGLMKVDVGVMPEGAFTSEEEVIGKVANVKALKGDILRDSRFVDHLEGSTLAALIPKDKRAITVRVNAVIGVGGFLLPGNHVDILAVKKKSGRAHIETVLRNIKILAVDQTAATEANDPRLVRVVTFEVYPRQAEIIVNTVFSSIIDALH